MKEKIKKIGLSILLCATAAFISGVPLTVYAEGPADDKYLADTDFVHEVENIIAGDPDGGEEVVGLNLSENVIFKGAFPSDEETSVSADEVTVAGVDKNLSDAIGSMETNVDISKYGITVEDANIITTEILNENPGYFYVDEVCVTYDDETKTADEVYLKYTYEAANDSSSYEDIVNKILSGIDSSWNDEQKLFYLHDYLATHCVYGGKDPDMYTAYSALVYGEAVCQGYALAFKDLVSRAGINVGLVVSQQKDHAWNIVELDGKKY